MGRVRRRAPHHVGFEPDRRSRLKVAAGWWDHGCWSPVEAGTGSRTGLQYSGSICWGRPQVCLLTPPARQSAPGMGPMIARALWFSFLVTFRCLVEKKKRRKKEKNRRKNSGLVLFHADLLCFRPRTDLRLRAVRRAAEDQDQDQDQDQEFEDSSVSPRTWWGVRYGVMTLMTSASTPRFPIYLFVYP